MPTGTQPSTKTTLVQSQEVIRDNTLYFNTQAQLPPSDCDILPEGVFYEGPVFRPSEDFMDAVRKQVARDWRGDTHSYFVGHSTVFDQNDGANFNSDAEVFDFIKEHLLAGIPKGQREQAFLLCLPHLHQGGLMHAAGYEIFDKYNQYVDGIKPFFDYKITLYPLTDGIGIEEKLIPKYISVPSRDPRRKGDEIVHIVSEDEDLSGEVVHFARLTYDAEKQAVETQSVRLSSTLSHKFMQLLIDPQRALEPVPETTPGLGQFLYEEFGLNYVADGFSTLTKWMLSSGEMPVKATPVAAHHIERLQGDLDKLTTVLEQETEASESYQLVIESHADKIEKHKATLTKKTELVSFLESDITERLKHLEEMETALSVREKQIKRNITKKPSAKDIAKRKESLLKQLSVIQQRQEAVALQLSAFDVGDMPLDFQTKSTIDIIKASLTKIDKQLTQHAKAIAGHMTSLSDESLMSDLRPQHKSSTSSLRAAMILEKQALTALQEKCRQFRKSLQHLSRCLKIAMVQLDCVTDTAEMRQYQLFNQKQLLQMLLNELEDLSCDKLKDFLQVKEALHLGFQRLAGISDASLALSLMDAAEALHIVEHDFQQLGSLPQESATLVNTKLNAEKRAHVRCLKQAEAMTLDLDEAHLPKLSFKAKRHYQEVMKALSASVSCESLTGDSLKFLIKVNKLIKAGLLSDEDGAIQKRFADIVKQRLGKVKETIIAPIELYTQDWFYARWTGGLLSRRHNIATAKPLVGQLKQAQDINTIVNILRVAVQSHSSDHTQAAEGGYVGSLNDALQLAVDAMTEFDGDVVIGEQERQTPQQLTTSSQL